ncbi:cysteine desulfurase [candidate division KSB1 bacterium]|nr:cysteine desulfurase [candidate division KSB1 bacterium]
MKTIYLDNSDTTAMLDEVVAAMLPYFGQKYGNPISLHSLGLEAEEAVSASREKLASFIGAGEEEIIFTGSATEANNLALFGVAHAYRERGNHIISTSIEHKSVLNPLRRLEREGFRVTYLPVDVEGFVDPDDLKKALSDETILVSIIHANNEIGTLQDLETLGKICRERGVPFHTDAAQSFTREELSVTKQNLDLVSINAHKIHGPKGVGALYVRRGIRLDRLMEGGEQERNRRPGTENVPGIVGFARAAEIAMDRFEDNRQHMRELRDRLARGLLAIDHTWLNGPKGKNIEKRLCNNVNITFHYIEGEAILMHLSLRGVLVSSGSACSSKDLTPSHVLTAISLKHEQAHGAIRFSLSKLNTADEVDRTIEIVKEVAAKLRGMTAFIPEEHSELVSKKAKTFYKPRGGRG